MTDSDRIRTAAFGLLMFPQAAFANAGVPMLFLVMPVLVLSIVPIIIIEAWYLQRRLQLPAGITAKTVTLSNLASTIIGVPLAWIVLVVIQVLSGGGSSYGLDTLFHRVLTVTWQAPWLIPYEADLDWMIPVAGLVLLLPFFLVSWWLEFLVTRSRHKDIDAVVVKNAVLNANIITYGLLSLIPLIMLLMPNE